PAVLSDIPGHRARQSGRHPPGTKRSVSRGGRTGAGGVWELFRSGGTIYTPVSAAAVDHAWALRQWENLCYPAARRGHGGHTSTFRREAETALRVGSTGAVHRPQQSRFVCP